MAATIIGLNVLGWGMLAAAAGGHYHITGTQLFGSATGVLAYTLGIRHAFDADHIAAIDNTTRKLVNDGKRPLSASTKRGCEVPELAQSICCGPGLSCARSRESA